jgi:hypothetical protein
MKDIRRRKFVAAAVLCLVLAALAIAGGVVVYRLGWSHGSLAAGDPGQSLGPPATGLAPLYPWGRGIHPFAMARCVLAGGLAFLMFAALAKVVRVWAWGPAHLGGRWRHTPPGHWHHHHFGPPGSGLPRDCRPWGSQATREPPGGADESTPAGHGE